MLVSGDEEYRSEQALPQLAAILSQRHGFHCTVLFAIDPKDGTIQPDLTTNIPGLEALDTADLMVLFTRFRDLPDAQMKHIVDYVEAGKPIVAMRTATHAFDIKSSPTYRQWSWNSKEWDGGFGRQVLGETWIAHHGKHKVQSTRAVFAAGHAGHPVLRGISGGEIWAPTDVYKVAAADGRRDRAAAAGAGAGRDEADGRAGRRSGQRSDDADRVDEVVSRAGASSLRRWGRRKIC